MNILLLGPQGSGKGTQARLLAEKSSFFYFEAGAFLRELSKTSRPDIGERINRGELVPGMEMFNLVKAFFEEKKLTDNIVFDGFPRTLEQYEAVKPWFKEKGMKLDVVFVLKISEEESIRRLSARRADPKTGKIYNLVTDKPPADVDVATLTQRDDDKPEAIKKRLDLYKQSTEPLIDALKKDTRVVEVDGERPIAEIQEELIKGIESHGMANG